MAIKKCKECGKDVSTKADNCPHCGAKQHIGFMEICGCLTIISIIIIIIVAIGINVDEEQDKPLKTQTVIERLIPDEEIKGGVEVVIIEMEELSKKSAHGGRLIILKGTVPFDIKRKQVRPTLLATIKKIKHDDPGCEWIVVSLGPNKKLTEKTHFVGRAEYTEEGIDIQYGIPSDKQMEENNALIGKKQKGVFGDEYINDSPRLFRPNKKEFEERLRVISVFYRIEAEKRKIADAEGRYGDYFPEAQLYELISEELNMPINQVKEYVGYVYRYYSPVWDKEKIELN